MVGDSAQQPKGHDLPVSAVGGRGAVSRRGGSGVEGRYEGEAPRPVLHRPVRPSDSYLREIDIIHFVFIGRIQRGNPTESLYQPGLKYEA